MRLVVTCLCCMAVTPSEIYKLNVDELRQLCSEERLSSEGPVGLLRPMLVWHLTGATIESKQHAETAQASVQIDVSLDATRSGPPEANFGSNVGGFSNVVPVIVELLRQVPSLTSDEPEAILRLVSKLDEIHSLGLVDDKTFVIRILPVLTGAVLRFFGGCLRNGRSWEQCKHELLREFFPISYVRG